MTDTAVNSASYSGVPEPSPAREIGSENSSVKSSTRPAKTRMANREGELRTSPSSASRSRAIHERGDIPRCHTGCAAIGPPQRAPANA